MKIFVTVGTQLPFDRLVETVDSWLEERPEISGFAQVGPSKIRPRRLKFASFIDAEEFRRHVVECSLVLAHAGMGSILTALELGKPIIVLPRRAAFGEHRNDHQIATARSLEALGRAVVAFDETELFRKLRTFDITAPGNFAPRQASAELIAAVRAFVFSESSKIGQATVLDMPASEADQERDMTSASVDAVADLSAEQFDQSLIDADHGVATAVRPVSHAKFKPVRRDLKPVNKGGTLIERLAAIVLLDGAVTRRTFSRSIGRSTLELPIDQHRTAMDHWIEQINTLREKLKLPELPCRIIVGHQAKPPQLRTRDVIAGFSVERDPSDFRGTGGLVRDVSAEYDPGSSLLVMSAGKILLPSFARAMVNSKDVRDEAAVLLPNDASPTSCFLATCEALSVIPPIGFIDLKEQGLAILAKKCGVRVIETREPIAMSIRTPKEYLSVLRYLHRGEQSFARDDEGVSSFSIVEAGAAVAPSAILHEAVVLSGARIDENSFVGSSIVCTGGRVHSNQEVVQMIVTAEGSSTINDDGRL